MSLEPLKTKGTPVSKQMFTWRDMVRRPISKLNADAFTRVRLILMHALERSAIGFSHASAWGNRDLRKDLAALRRIEQHQATLIYWLLPPDGSPLETSVAVQQTAIEVTAMIAQAEMDSALSKTYRFSLLEDFDLLYRLAALMDRLEGQDANIILQSYTDILPGRPSKDGHRHPIDDLRQPYRRSETSAMSKIRVRMALALAGQAYDYYMATGVYYADPLARQLYAEIASLKEQQVSQYESLIDPEETVLERWLLQELTEVYGYYSCLQWESDGRVRAVWERFLDYELGQLQHVAELFGQMEGREAAEVIPERLPEPMEFESQREFIRKTLKEEIDLRADGCDYVDKANEPERSHIYRRRLHGEGCPSETVAAGYRWRPGGELNRDHPKTTH